MSDNKITFYYYTAWDGFAWQGCDEQTARSLQGYMDATKTLPSSPAEEPPFGGVVPCKISGQVGVAVYRYLTRKKGDLSGRDSLYIALAFIPLDVGCVDFAKLLELPQLSEPKSGILQPETISVEEFDLKLRCEAEAYNDWFDFNISNTEYSVLKGRLGLRRLSLLFFSKKTQLGFLNAVFSSDSGLDDLVSRQSYYVYPEVIKVVNASKAVKEAKIRCGGGLERGHQVVKEMESALNQLYKWWENQRGYSGLLDYYNLKKSELDCEFERQEAILAYSKRLAQLIDSMQDYRLNNNWRDAVGAEQCISKIKNLALDVVSLPFSDNECYKNVLKQALNGMREAAMLQGRIIGERRAMEIEEAAIKLKVMCNEKLQKAEAEKRELEREVGVLNLELKKTRQSLPELPFKIKKHDLQSKLTSIVISPLKKNKGLKECVSSILFKRSLVFIIILILAVVIFLTYKIATLGETPVKLDGKTKVCSTNEIHLVSNANSNAYFGKLCQTNAICSMEQYRTAVVHKVDNVGFVGVIRVPSTNECRISDEIVKVKGFNGIREVQTQRIIGLTKSDSKKEVPVVAGEECKK